MKPTCFHPSTETQRNFEETSRNEQRFDALNDRRVERGLPPLLWTDYLGRKHHLLPIGRIQQLSAGSAHPENRDNVVLLTR